MAEDTRDATNSVDAQPDDIPASPELTTDKTAGDESESIVSSLRGDAAHRNLPVPAWERRLTGKDKLRRIGVIAAAMALAMAVLLASTGLPQATWQRVTLSLRPSSPTATLPPWNLPPLLPSYSRGKLAMTNWQSIPVPDAGRSQVSFTPFPSDPNSIFACTASRNIPGQGPLAGPVKLWRTHDTGQHWQPLPLPALTADTCIVRIDPQDSTPHYILLLTYTSSDPSLCQSPALFVSTTDGASWTPLNPPHHREAEAGDTPLRCDAWATASYLYWYEADTCQLLQPASCDEFLRSSDGGKTWVHADNGIANGLFSPVWISMDTGEVQMVGYVPIQATSTTRTPATTLWITYDAGNVWTPLGDFPHSAPTQTIVSQGNGLPFPSEWNAIYRELFDPTGNSLQNIVQSVDGAQWSTLPPLPIPSTDPHHPGIAQVIGEDTAGNLLVLGPDPQKGVTLIGPNHVPDTPQADRIWEWNPQTWQWSVGALEVPVLPEDVALDWGFSTDGSVTGTWVWLVSPSARGTALTRTFLPE